MKRFKGGVFTLDGSLMEELWEEQLREELGQEQLMEELWLKLYLQLED